MNEIRFDKLHKKKRKIEKEFGGKLDWDRMNGRRACCISIYFEGITLKDKDKWDELQDKMIETMIRMEKAFRKYIKELD